MRAGGGKTGSLKSRKGVRAGGERPVTRKTDLKLKLDAVDMNLSDLMGAKWGRTALNDHEQRIRLEKMAVF